MLYSSVDLLDFSWLVNMYTIASAKVSFIIDCQFKVRLWIVGMLISHNLSTSELQKKFISFGW